MMTQLIDLLHQGDNTLAIANGGEIKTFTDRGVSALYNLLDTNPDFLKGAIVADKVVGKGAAALMIIGGVATLYTDVASDAAISLLEKSSVNFICKQRVAQINNRANTGACPVETLCKGATTAEECLPLIKHFIESNKNR